MAGFDWAELERDLTPAVVRNVSGVVAGHPDERFRAAALWLLYRESDGVISVPLLAVATAGNVHWNPADWDYEDVGLLPDDSPWQHDLTVYACRGTSAQWDAAFRRFVTVLVKVCRRARRELGLPVVVIDGELHETVIPRILSKAEVSRHFPELDAEAAAWARLAALPAAEQAAELVGRLDAVDGPILSEGAERALRDLGAVAVPALLPLLAVRGRAWRAAKVLADIGRADDEVVAALTTALRRLDGPDRSWVAAALSRLGHLDVVLAASVPVEVVVTAVAAPYTSFRDHTVDPPLLDYAPLVRVLEQRPETVAGLAAELGPGMGSMCELRAGEVDEALRGTGSPHVVVRRHAVNVLWERSLGATVGRRVLPVLARLAVDDPDELVRRLAVVALSFWGRHALPHLDVARAALRDADATVREAAANWLRDAGAAPVP